MMSFDEQEVKGRLKAHLLGFLDPLLKILIISFFILFDLFYSYSSLNSLNLKVAIHIKLRLIKVVECNWK